MEAGDSLQELNTEGDPAPTRADRIAVTFALVFPPVMTYIYFVYLTQAEQVVQNVVFGGGKVIQFALPIVWFLFVQKQRLRIGRPRAAGMLPSLAFGAAVLAGMWLLYLYLLVPLGWVNAPAVEIRLKISSFGIDSLASYAAMGIFYSLIHSLAEEYYWRWFVFGQLRRMVSLWLAIVVSSLGFTAHHIFVLGLYFGYDNPLTWVFAASIAFGGGVWAWLYHRSGSLYPVWWSHLLIDVGIFTIGYHLVGDMFH